MERSWLIQRLMEPRQVSLAITSVSRKARDILDSIITFDYMGSSEFEFGTVPKALQKIGEYSSKKEGIQGELELKKPVYYICSKEQENYVKDLIKKIAEEGDYGKLHFLEPTRFKEALEGEKYYNNLKGWFELDNGFMFFIDKEMSKKMANVFDIKAN
jgi:hypothetical protein